MTLFVLFIAGMITFAIWLCRQPQDYQYNKTVSHDYPNSVTILVPGPPPLQSSLDRQSGHALGFTGESDDDSTATAFVPNELGSEALAGI